MTPLGWLIAGLALALGAGGGYLLGRRSGESVSPAARPRLPGPFPLGMAAGLLFVAVVGGLAFWIAGVDSAAPPTAVATESSSAPAPAEQSVPLSPALAELDRHILAHPEDLDARREMALMLLSESRFMDALGQADQVLARRAGDPTALYVQGVVRLNMGQRERGRALLEQALETDPDHVHSLIALGRLHLQENRRDEALSVLRTALQAAGGRHPGIERMIDEAESGAS